MFDSDQNIERLPHGRVGQAERRWCLAYDLWTDRTFIFKDLDPGLLVLTGFAVFGPTTSRRSLGWGARRLR